MNILPQKATSVVYPSSTAAQGRRFKCSISAAFLDKKALKGQASYNAFAPQTMTLSGLLAHIRKGYAWMPAAAAPQTRKAFQSAQLLALDFDNDAGNLPVSAEALKQHAFIGQFAAIVYETASSTPERPKSRAVFVLDSPIASAEGFTAAAAALIDLCSDLRPDIACKDASRLFFGAQNSNSWINEDAVLALGILREHVADMRNQDAVTERRLKASFDAAHKDNQDYARKAAQDAQGIKNPHLYALSALENNAAAAARATKGHRNTTLFIQAWKTYCVFEACGLSDSDIEREFWAAGRAAGLPDNEIRITLESARRYPRVVLNAMSGRAIGPDKPKGRKNPARADNSPMGELNYYNIDEAAAQEYISNEALDALEAVSAGPLAQDIAPLDLDVYPGQMPDEWVFAIRASYGGAAAGLLNALYVTLAHGYLASAQGVTTEAILKALGAAGYVFTEKRIRNTLSTLVKAELLEKEKAKPKILKTAHKEIDMCMNGDVCAVSGILPANTHLYRVLNRETLLQRIKARMLEALLDSFYPHDHEAQDAERAALLTPDAMRYTLETLGRRKLNALSAESVFAAIPSDLKLKNYHDAAARAEKARRKLVFYDVLRSIPMPATRNNLAVFGFSPDEGALLAERINAQLLAQDEHGVIALKWRLLMRCYERRLSLLQDTTTTPFTQLSLESAKAQVDALGVARTAQYDNKPLSASKQAELLGVDNRASAVRLSKRLGITREEQKETRRLVVMRRPECPMILDEDIRAAIRAVIKRGEYAVRVYSLDAAGRVIDSAMPDDIEGLQRGVSFEVMIQKASIIHIGQQRAQDAAANQDERPAAEAAQDAAQEAQNTERPAAARAAGPRRRVYRTTLYTPEFVYFNTLRGLITYEANYDMWCVKGDEGVLYETIHAALASLIEMPLAEAV